MPFTYLGVPIFVGAPKGRFLQPLVDKSKLKLASWKGKSLSMMCRIQLVNTVITGVISYSFNLYKWPVSLLKQVEQWCRNFIWTGDILKKGIATVNWATLCSPFENDNLRIINLHHENNVYLLKLAWNFAYSNRSLIQTHRWLKTQQENSKRISHLKLQSWVPPNLKTTSAEEEAINQST